VDVTVVTDVEVPGAAGYTRVETFAGVQVPELWLTLDVPSRAAQGRVKGKVTGWAGRSEDLSVSAYGDRLEGPGSCCAARTDATGAYDFDAMAPSPRRTSRSTTPWIR
jgi:hypothetical protein